MTACGMCTDHTPVGSAEAGRDNAGAVVEVGAAVVEVRVAVVEVGAAAVEVRANGVAGAEAEAEAEGVEIKEVKIGAVVARRGGLGKSDVEIREADELANENRKKTTFR